MESPFLREFLRTNVFPTWGEGYPMLQKYGIRMLHVTGMYVFGLIWAFLRARCMLYVRVTTYTF